jgi:hypothetical protein
MKNILNEFLIKINIILFIVHKLKKDLRLKQILFERKIINKNYSFFYLLQANY